MAVILAPKFYKDLLELLGKSLPHSALVHAIVRSMTLGIPAGFQIWVDEWPNPKAVVVSADESKCQNEYRRNLVFIHTFSNNTLPSVVKVPGVVNFRRKLLFFGLALQDLQTLERIFPEKSFLDDGTCHVLAVSSRQQVVDKPLPEGFYIGEFTRDLVDLVVKNWEFAAPGVEDDIYDTFKWGFPAIAVYDSQDEPVAWVTQHLAGMIGYLHVVEKYRRRGIASAILSMITKLIIDKDGFAFSSVLKDNVQSIKLHENVGFTQVQTDGSFFRLVPPA